MDNRLKELADFLTGIRLVVSVLILIAAFAVGKAALPTVSVMVLLGWLTDSIDGSIARKSGSKRRSWLGENDLGIDVFLGFSFIIYATASGYISWPVATGYIVLLLFAALVFHSRSLIVTFIGLSYTVFLYITLKHLFPAFVAALAVGLFAVLFTRHRIAENLGTFFRGYRELVTGTHEDKGKRHTEGGQEV